MSRFVHSDHYPDNTASARIILPLFFEVAGSFKSALDVGGGTGAWACVLKDLGLERVFCMDDTRIEKDQLLVDSMDFLECDLDKDFPEPIPSDLVLCLEVAEHLQFSRSRPLVKFLASCAEVVLFSSSIPGQPSEYHVNEQPPEFWMGLFADVGYRRYDCIRPLIIENSDIPYWYRQNLFVFASEKAALKKNLNNIPFRKIPADFELVHERILNLYRADSYPVGLRRWVQKLPEAVRSSMRKRI